MAQVAASDKQLRVAFVWNGALQIEHTLDTPEVVELRGTPNAMFPLPDEVTDEASLRVLEPSERGYQLLRSEVTRGSVWLDGVRHEIDEMRESSVTLGPNDYGVVTIGPVALFFQHVARAKKAPRRMFGIEAELVASVGLSIFMHAAIFLLLFLAQREAPDPDRLELPTDLIARFMVTPPPESPFEEERARTSGTETEDPGMLDRDEQGGERSQGDEGQTGREDATSAEHEIEGETGVIAQRVRNVGLLGALSGGADGNAIAAALNAPSVSDVLGGLRSARTLLGRGNGGTGLRGSGGGGGGTGAGSLLGGGELATGGAGAGAGRGQGRGRGGLGAATKRAETRISVEPGTPTVSNGYLSAEQINRVVRANSAAVRFCYENEIQRRPNLRGRVQIEWRINLQGSVTSARVAQSTLGSPPVEGCMVRQIRRWQFPRPDGGEVVVRYPFVFGVQGG